MSNQCLGLVFGDVWWLFSLVWFNYILVITVAQ